MNHLRSCIVLLLAISSACSGGGGVGESTVDTAPKLTITEPAAAITVTRGGFVRLGYTDSDPDNEALTQLFADVDNDLATADDQYPLSDVRPEQNGAAQTFLRELAGVPEANYVVVGLIRDGVNGPVQVKGPGKLRVGNLAWARRDGGTRADASNGIATLPDGSCVVTGSYTGTATFGEGWPNQTILSAAQPTYSEMFVARYGSDSALAWVRSAPGTPSATGRSIAAFADGSCVVTGSYTGTATFGAGEANQTILSAASPPFSDVFVARYAIDGSLVWARSAAGTHWCTAWSIAGFADGSCVVTGDFLGSVSFGVGEPNQTLLTAAIFSPGAPPTQDIFVARYASDGSLMWAKRAGSQGGDNARGIAALADGSCVVTGDFEGSATFGPGEPNETLLTTVGFYPDLFLARYASDGSLVWVKRAGGLSLDYGKGIVGLADGSCVVTGRFADTATFGAGEPNQTVLLAGHGGTQVGECFVARYASDGSLLWAKDTGGGSIGVGNSIATVVDSSFVVTGQVTGNVTFGVGEPNETTFNASGVFVARYTHDGFLVWATQAEGGVGNGIAPLADGSCVVTGFFDAIATFGMGQPKQTILNFSSNKDVFLARFNADGGF